MNFEFKVDAEIKHEFLDTKPSKTARSNRFVLKFVDEFEQLIGKKIYNMSYGELQELIAQFKNSSLATITKNVSILRKYIDFCIEKNIVSHMENRLAVFTRQKAREFVSRQATEYKYITREELMKYQDMLVNEQDVALLEAVYNGIRGRTEEGATLEELINLQIDEKSSNFRNNVLELVKNNGNKRSIQVSDRTMQILLDAKKQEFYLSNNGEKSEIMRGGIRRTPINQVGNYVFRVPGSKKYELINPVLINSRMGKIQRWIGNKYVTIHSLYMSGMISMAKDLLAQKGKLTRDDYVSICERYDYGNGDPQKYWLTLKDTVQQYI
ncbi:MAG TPA: hypothetical protein GXX36_01160 [Clostridiaceae bacterium]|nr:hypothetical protein [Clostridiaceae bacterium]